MTLINEDEQQIIARLIANLEQHTDAEFVAVLARRSDDYRYVPFLWAAVIALIIPLLALFTPFWMNTTDILLVQWSSFVLMSVLFSIPRLRTSLIPKPVRYWRAANMARRQFLENNLHHTTGETGVLLFVSEAERYVEIIADRGINQLIAHAEWQGLIDHFVLALRAGNTHQGLIDCINGCGELLKQRIPLTHKKNELPNHLVVV